MGLFGSFMNKFWDFFVCGRIYMINTKASFLLLFASCAAIPREIYAIILERILKSNRGGSEVFNKLVSYF